MRYMLLSDIHGSLPRLRRALDFYKAQRCDMLLLMGDILNYGPRNGVPEGLDAPGIAQALNAMADDIVAVRGNCDSEVDQMLLQFPILSWMRGVASCSPTDTSTTRRRYLRGASMPWSTATRISGSSPSERTTA